MVSTPQSGQVDSGFPGEGGLSVRDEGRWFPQYGVHRDLGQVFHDGLLMNPRLFRSPWGDWRQPSEESTVVGSRGPMDISGGRGGVVQVIARVAWRLSIGVELGASHVQVVSYREDFRFGMEVRDGGRLGASCGNTQSRVLDSL